MSKTKERINKTAEFFTPMYLVNEMIDKVEETNPNLFIDPTLTTCDPTCGNGQFIMGMVKRKHERGMTKQEAILSTLGSDLMIDNICDTVARLIFWEKWDIEIIDPDTCNPLPELIMDSHEDSHDIYWLYENYGNCDGDDVKCTYIRTYKYGENTVTVRSQKDYWWLIEYNINGGKNYKKTYQRNFLVADVLQSELLFPKTDKEAHGMEPGYVIYAVNKKIEEERKLKEEELKESQMNELFER